MQSKQVSPNKGQQAVRIRALLGVDLCACGRTNSAKCEGACRQAHMRGRVVRCAEVYQVQPPRKAQRPKRHRPFKPAAKTEKDVARQRFDEKRGYES